MLKIIRICDKCGNGLISRKIKTVGMVLVIENGIVKTGDFVSCQIPYICPKCVHPDVLREEKKMVQLCSSRNTSRNNFADG